MHRFSEEDGNLNVSAQLDSVSDTQRAIQSSGITTRHYRSVFISSRLDFCNIPSL